MSLQTEHAAAETSSATSLANLTSATVTIEAEAATIKGDRAAVLAGDVPMSRTTAMFGNAPFLASVRALCDRLAVAEHDLRAST